MDKKYENKRTTKTIFRLRGVKMKKNLPTHEEEKGYKYPSVTTILGILRKVGLEYWLKVNTASFCDAESAKAREIGTSLHEAIQHHIGKTGIGTETKYPDEVGIAIQSFVKFQVENPEIKLIASELVIESKLGYSGTLDCRAENDGVPVILDWKTGKKKLTIYPEYHYQIAAYI
ncbi:MAG: hypothetical protein V1769_06580, partial [Thermoplasmatota archaeon]